MRKDYARFVELSNKGARELDYRTPARCGAASTTCRPTPLRRSWIGCGTSCVRCICRCTPTCARELHEKYGALVPERRADSRALLGNLWQQDWSNIYDLVSPPGDEPVSSLTDNLKAQKIEPLEMVRIR